MSLRNFANLLHVIFGPSPDESLRLSCVVSVLPVVGNAGIPKNKLYEIGEARLRTHVIGENYNAPLGLFKAHDRVRSLLVVSTLEEAMPLRPIEDYNAKSCIEVFTLLAHWKHRSEVRELVCCGEV